MRLYRPQPLYNDSYQYLSVAENLNRGRGLTTSLVHFDTERSHGRIPAPLTSFPPGYPAVVALASRLAGDDEGAARAVSLVSHAGTAALLAWALLLAGVSAFFRRVVLLLFATNAVALNFSTAVLSESLYMLLSTGALAAFSPAGEAPRPARVVLARAVAAHALGGPRPPGPLRRTVFNRGDGQPRAAAIDTAARPRPGRRPARRRRPRRRGRRADTA